MIAESFLAHGVAALKGGDRHQIVVHVDVETLRESAAERLRASAGRHPNIDVVVIAGADHSMATSVSFQDQIDPRLSSREAPDSAEYFGLLAAWLAEHGVARAP